VQSRSLRWAEEVAKIGKMRNADTIKVEKPLGKWSLGRLRKKWEDNINMDLMEVGG
jgi:hypothetical protein